MFWHTVVALIEDNKSFSTSKTARSQHQIPCPLIVVAWEYSLQIPLGSSLSGPFMNPAFAFSWFYHLKGADLWEHLVVYWAGCLLGSYMAGLAWLVLVKQVRSLLIASLAKFFFNLVWFCILLATVQPPDA